MKHERQEVPPKPPKPEVLHHITLTEEEAVKLESTLSALNRHFASYSVARQLLDLLTKRNSPT